jgi:MoxR-like ATPase
MFKVFVEYPNYEEEYRVADTTTRVEDALVNEILSGDEIKKIQGLVRRVPVPPHVIHYALRLVRATRINEEEGVPESMRELLSWGAGPRAVQFLLLGAKAKAVMDGRSSATVADVKSIVHPVLRHRIITTFNAESSGVTTDDVVDNLLSEISERDEGDKIPPTLSGAFNAA